MNFNDLITRGGEANQQSLETITTLQGIFEKPNPTKVDFMKVPNVQAMWARYSKLSGKQSDMLEDTAAVSVRPIKLKEGQKDGWDAVADIYKVSREKGIEFAKLVLSPRYKDKQGKVSKKDDLRGIDPLNWTPEQRKQFEEAMNGS